MANHGLLLINWSGKPIPSAELLVLRRVAVSIRTVLQATRVEFTHDRCAGLVRFERAGVFGAVGGLFFFADLGAKDGQPNTTNFFVPRSMLHVRPEEGLVTSQSLRRAGDRFVPSDYPDDIEPEVAAGAGSLTVRVRED
jgi:hypothetical protein